MNPSLIINLKEHGDIRGKLISIESNVTVPFEVKRVYYIYGTSEGVSRGAHAHRNLQQLAVAVAGKCQFILDTGNQKSEIWLNSPTVGLLIGKMVWREMHEFSPDCVLMVLASEHYDEQEYIRDYQLFMKELKDA